jgi:carboxypeptidase C (cathepsin A)
LNPKNEKMPSFAGVPFLWMAITAITGAGIFSRFTYLTGSGTISKLLEEGDISQPKTKAGISSYTLAAQKDLITDLPGLRYDLGFKQFSGYLTVDEDHGRHLFYWYVESQGDPDEDPVVLWSKCGSGGILHKFQWFEIN